MALPRSTQNYTFDQCIRDFKEYYKDSYQEQLESPMPWVGMYVAAASAACTLAMAADVFNGFRRKKLWFPSKYFSLNAFSLTVLTVAMKLPVDLSTQMAGVNDRIARISALVLMATAMANFVPSLGSIGNNEVVLNLAALGILVITIVGNVCIRLYGSAYMQIVDEELGSIGCMFYLLLFLLILCSSSVMVPTAKAYIELQYNQMHKRISNERVNRVGEFTCDELRVAVRRYWVMSESGDPQFVTARSVIGVTSGIMCLSMAITLLVSHVRIRLMMKFGSWIYDNAPSSYKWSIDWILFIQSIGVAVGTIAPLLRWFTAAKFKSTKLGDKSFKDELKVEAYWTQRLMNWRESPIPLKNRNLKFRKTLHDAKRLLLNFCIGVQILLVQSSKLVLLISAVFVKGLLLCFNRIKDFVKTNDSREYSSGSSDSNDLNDYVLLLEDEPKLPKRTLKNICSGMDKLIRTGKKNQSKNLIKLLQKSMSFNGVREFDSSEVRRLHSQEPRNCWSLPVVTLTSIAISLPNVTDHKSYQLISAVSEGLHFAQVIGKTLDSSGELVNMRKATDVVWVGIELYKRWQDKDLRAAELKGRTHKETLQNLADIAEKTVTNFKTSTNDSPVQDPLNWPVGVIAANSMYRITRTILLAHDDDHPQTDEELFERLSIMISDILAACLTNIARVISLKCHSNAIEEREESIRQAALLLGESEVILETLQQRELPNLDPEVAADIEGWRAFMEYGYENPVSSSPQTNFGHVFV